MRMRLTSARAWGRQRSHLLLAALPGAWLAAGWLVTAAAVEVLLRCEEASSTGRPLPMRGPPPPPMSDIPEPPPIRLMPFRLGKRPIPPAPGPHALPMPMPLPTPAPLPPPPPRPPLRECLLEESEDEDEDEDEEDEEDEEDARGW